MGKTCNEIFLDNIPNMTGQVFDNWLPRMVSGGCDINDILRIRKKLTGWEEWPTLWAEQGDRHLELAEGELSDGHLISAAHSFHRAAMYYHYGHFMLFDRPELKSRMYEKSREILTKYLSVSRYGGKQIYIPYAGKKIPAILREHPKANGRIVYQFGGADANKEEMLSFSEYFLERDISVIIVDNPGQGEAATDLPLTRVSFDGAVKAVVDYIRGLGYTKIAVGGISLGGYLGPRAAAVCPDDFVAAYGCGGPFKLDVRKMGPIFYGDFAHVFGVTTEEELYNASAEVDLSDVISNLTCPLMIVHGTEDKIIGVEESRLIVDASSSSEPRLVIIDGGNHVCNNFVYKYRPLIADWVTDRLSR